MALPSGLTPHPRHTQNSSRSARILDAALSPQSRQCMRMPPKRPIGGSGDAGAAEAPEHGVEMETEVAVTAGEVSPHPDVVELPQPEAEFHTDSGDDSGDDPDDDSDDHSNDDGQLVSHLYPFMCQIDPRVSLVTPASPLLE